MKTLLKRAASSQRLAYAWESIRHRPESKGFDEQTISEFGHSLGAHLKKIRKELLDGTYSFSPLRGMLLSQGEKKRPLRIPAVRDRVVQKAIEQTIYPYLKEKHSIINDVSFAYVKDGGVRRAADKVRSYYRAGYKWAYEADIKKFFDSVDREKLLRDMVYPALPDASINKLIADALNAELGNADELRRAGVFEKFPGAGEGIPQGGVLSPLFANVYLAPLDAAMKRSMGKMVRYADDFLVLCKTEEDAKSIDKLARAVVEDDLGLYIYRPGEEKGSKVSILHNVEFIGLCFQGEKIMPGAKAVKKMVATIKAIPKEYGDTDLASALSSVRSRMQTWGATYHYTDVPVVFCEDIDRHLIAATLQLLNAFGLTSKGGVFGAEQLAKVGIPTFSKALERARAQEVKKNDANETSRKRSQLSSQKT